MFTFEADGKTYEAKVTFYTAHIYEMEFRSDLIRDLFGVQTAEQPLEVERTGDGEEDYRIVKIDFTKVNWTVVTKALWAAVKTANPGAPSYAEWTLTPGHSRAPGLNQRTTAQLPDTGRLT